MLKPWRACWVLLGLSAAAVHSQITYTPMFNSMKFSAPVYIGEMPGMPGTFVVVEHEAANIVVVQEKNGQWTRSNLYSRSVLTNSSSREPGLLGLAFHPDFKTNRKYYISYNPPGGPPYTTVLEERTVDSTYLKDAGTTRQLLTLTKDASQGFNHNGGNLEFSPKDGYLYFSPGDGNPEDDPNHFGQNLNSFRGKVLRIDVDHQGTGLQYAIPADNPFVNGGGSPEIFAYGFRNPWRFSFDPLNGNLWLGDVGQDTWEEVDTVTKGANYGWSVFEANSCYNNGNGNPGINGCPSQANYAFPVYAYNHSTGQTCIIGGRVFRGNPASKYYGTYFVSDYTGRGLKALTLTAGGTANATSLNGAPDGPSSFGTDSEGYLYLVGFGTGLIYRLDSPDLTPAPTFVKELALPPAQRRKIFTATPGSALDFEAFAKGDRLELISLRGERVGEVSSQNPKLPAGIHTGVYGLQPTTAPRGETDLLFVP